MKTIPLTQGKVALVDDESYVVLAKYKWCAVRMRNTFYAFATIDGRQTNMAWLVCPGSCGQVDHRDRDGLNNQAQNLRRCSIQQNAQNRDKPAGVFRSDFKGVSWDNERAKWRVDIQYNGKRRFLAYCLNEKDAAMFYNVAAQLLFGEFACINHGI